MQEEEKPILTTESLIHPLKMLDIIVQKMYNRLF